MTLFAFFWAALLPHHPAIVPQSPPLLTASPYTAVFSLAQDTVASRPYSLLHLPASLYEPLQLKPQLFWPTEAVIDWSQWTAAAAVTVVAQPNSAHRPQAEARLGSAALGACGAQPTAQAAADGFTIQVRNVPIGQVPSRQAAKAIAAQIREALPRLEATPHRLTPSLGETKAAGQIDGQTVFSLSGLDQPSDQPARMQAPLQATQWVNNLRLAFGALPLEASQMQMVAEGLSETGQTIEGTASWYGPYFHGRQTATGETFNQHEMTAAHKTLPFGTYLKVLNQLNGKSVVVRINDRGPYIGDRSLDLSYAAAQCLGAEQVGLIPYQATILAPGLPQAWRADTVAALP